MREKMQKKLSNPELKAISYKLKASSGQLLIEMLVALGILTVGFLGVMTLLSRALGLNRVVADNYAATYLASEGVEVVKNILDSNPIRGRGWNEGFSSGDFEVDADSLALGANQDRFLTFDSGTHRYGYGFTQTTPYKRTISIILGSNEVTVNSKVNWISRGGGTFSINLEDHFFNWR